MAINKNTNFKKNKLLVFLHIPKTGGTTLTEIIERQIGVNHFYDVKKDIRKAVKFIDDKEIKCIKGHMPFGIHKYIKKSCKYITMVRDPFDTAISSYYYILRKKNHHLYEKVKKLDFEGFLK